MNACRVRTRITCLFLGLFLLGSVHRVLAELATSGSVDHTRGIDYPVVGRVAAKHARDIEASPWSIGGETIDRGFTVYSNYRAYLGPLGAKRLRLQAGWAKCETKPGVYNWEWLDAIIDDAKSQGVQPWVELSYGNTIYPKGGGIGLADGFPSSPEALAAWDRWVTTLVRRYKDRINEWEIWNEPDINKTGEAGVVAYTDLHIRTAKIIRSEQVNSRIFALGLAGKLQYAEAFLQQMVDRKMVDLVDAITIHGYPKNPDDIAPLLKLRGIIARMGLKIEVRQGETGAPSKYQANFALSKMQWTENSQAKWDLRRLLAHRAADIPINLFCMCDMHYRNPDGSNLRMNYKGLLGTNPDQTVSHAKPIYYAAQAVFSIFDGSVKRVPDVDVQIAAVGKWTTVLFEQGKERFPLVAFWRSEGPVLEENNVQAVTLRFPKTKWRNPVLVDLRTCLVYRLPKEAFRVEGEEMVFLSVPGYDSPMLIADEAALPINQAR